MARFLKTNLDPEGKALRIDAGIKAANGDYYAVVTRMPPHYEQPPTFVLQLTDTIMPVRGRHRVEDTIYRANTIRGFSDKEIDFVLKGKKGAPHAPFFNFSYPTLLKVFGKTFYKMTDDEIGQITDSRVYKLIRPDS